MLLVSIVFSGLVPNIVRLENSRPYQIAKALGAKVSETITESTTHLVAASVLMSSLLKQLKIFNFLQILDWHCKSSGSAGKERKNFDRDTGMALGMFRKMGACD